MIDSVTVVIRAAGERTAELARLHAAAQVSQGHIVTVSNAPFSATLADSYRAGIEGGRPWTLCIDADVLVSSGAVGALLDMATQVDTRVCTLHGRILDKLFGVPRQGGARLYRTSLLPMALARIPSEGKTIRPESYVIKQMMREGHPWAVVPLVVGLHDFEQYYRDIFRKAYVHASKFHEHKESLIRYWKRKAHEDADYQVALWGFEAGLTARGDVSVDVRQDRGANKVIASRQLQEKHALVPDMIDVERVIADWEIPEEHMHLVVRQSGGAMIGDKPATAWHRLNERRLNKGPFGLIPWLFRWGFARTHRHLRRRLRGLTWLGTQLP